MNGRARRIFYAILAATVAAHAVVAAVRLASIVRFSRLIPAPIEGPGLYAMWKIQHGYPLYEWPTRPFFGLTLYNFLFYETYARMLALVGVTDAAIPTGAKLLTLPFAIAGAVIQYAATRTILRRFGISDRRALVAAIAFLVWLGAGVVGRWAMQARPDVAAAMMAVCGLALVLRSLDERSRLSLAGASVVFFLAWAFKQSTVGIFAGVCVFELVVRRSVRSTLMLALPFTLLAGVTLAAGGSAYRFNLLTAPTLNGRMIPWLAVYWYRQIVLPNLPIWVAVIAGVWQWMRARGTTSSPRRDDAMTMLLCTIATSFVLDSVLLAKPGSVANHTFEFWTTSALFGTVTFVLLLDRSVVSARRAFASASLLMLAPLAFALALLVRGPAVVGRVLSLGTELDRLEFGSVAEYARRSAVADRLRNLPKPILIDDEILGQPWFANDGRYPAIVIDHVFYDAADQLGRLERDGLMSMIDDRYFAAILVAEPPWQRGRRAAAAGYVRAGRLSWEDEYDLAIFIRSDSTPRTPFQKRRPTTRRMP